jgi:hypothetical protein
MAILLAFSTFYFFLLVFQCHPVRYYWTQYAPNNDPEGTCINPRIFLTASYAYGAISEAVDWVLGLLPIWIIWGLNMNVRTKASVGILLSLGMM